MLEIHLFVNDATIPCRDFIEVAMAKELNDATFLQQFLDHSLASEYFDHIGHLRMAWLMLDKYGLEGGAVKGSQAIKQYATSLGAAEKYHHTISIALFHLMYFRGLDESWQSFVDNQSDLVHNSLSVLKAHYSEALLFSDDAKQSFQQPDIKAFC
jgi:hypothetical protein